MNLFTSRAIRFYSTISIKFLPELVIFDCVVVMLVAVGCHARSGSGIKFHGFARHPKSRKIWTDKVRRKDGWQPNDDFYLCNVSMKNTFF